MTEEALKETVPAEALERAEAVLRERFRHCGLEDPGLKAIFRHGVERTARDLAFGPPAASPDSPPKARAKAAARIVDPIDLLKDNPSLPSLPQIFFELQTALARPTASASDLARVIGRDPGLSALLLRMVNSAFYSFPSRIDSISRAVTVVGVRQLSLLAMGSSVMDLFKDIHGSALDLKGFWMHSVACGTVARELCRVCKTEKPERCFVAGLLHDIGLMVLAKSAPEALGQALDLARAEGLPLHLAERRLMGFDHARLGGMLLQKWRLPFELVGAVIEHHSAPGQDSPDEALAVHLAEIIVCGLGVGNCPENAVPRSEPGDWERLGLDEQGLDQVILEAGEKIDEALSILMRA
ncbi:MAG: HDOD domain-containing protein [Desulfovibrionaceae bacterium]|nr:HDOD domain-containing protein [Desulfovibrionaceae bacterium]